MISYESSSWGDIVARWRGTILSSCWPKIAALACYVTVAYILQVLLECNFGVAFKNSYIVGRSLSFLLVFRANSSYERYWTGRQHCAEFFASARDLAMLSCALFKGGQGQYVWNRRQGSDGFSVERKSGLDDLDDQRTSAARVDIVRWALALVVAFRIHMRVTASGDAGCIDEEAKWKLNFDRMRLRTLMSKREFDEVDAALKVEDTGVERRLLWQSGRSEPDLFHRQGPPLQPGGLYEVSTEPSFRQLILILNFIATSVRLHANEPYAYKERFLPAFITRVIHLTNLVDLIHQAITSPLPLPFLNLVRTLLVLYLFATPFFIDYTDGFLANVVMTVLTATALLGIDQIGTELENPFGEDVNDLDFQAMIMALEKEMLRTLELSGDVRARDCFTWLPVPEFMRAESDKPFLWYVALKKEVSHVHVPRFRDAGGLRVRHVNVELSTVVPC